MNYDEARKKLEEYVSPSDIPLFDLLSIHTDGIKTTLEIFSDRNPHTQTTSLALAVIQTLIAVCFSKKVEMENLEKVIAKGEDIND